MKRIFRRVLALVLCLVFCFIGLNSIEADAKGNYYVGGLDYSLVFNTEYYYNNYPDLQRAFGYNESKLFEHFITCGMKEGRVASEDFDVTYYRNKYADLNNVFGNDLASYFKHYITYGYKEGRQGNSITVYKGVDYGLVFDPEYYYNTYYDLQVVFGKNPKALLEHFVTCGMKEGRQGCETFNFGYYYSKYADLRNAFGDNRTMYYEHYISYGKDEGRQAYSMTFYNGVEYEGIIDIDYYYNKYADLRAAFGYNPKALMNHFMTCGINEGRRSSAYFDIAYYKNTYKDLRTAFGDENIYYLNHYLQYGKNEGRKAVDIVNGWYTTGSEKMYYQNGMPVTDWKNIDGRMYYFNSDGILKSKTGIDVSSHQGDIDWERVKNDGIEFAIIRIGYGKDLTHQDDSKANRNMDMCEKYGIPYGVYIYSYALTSDDVDSEIAHTLRMIQGRNPSMGVFFDMEDADGYKDRNGMPSNEQLNEFCIRFNTAITNAGYKSGTYASTYWFDNTLTSTSLDCFVKWIAQWAALPTYKGKFVMWQYTSDGTVDGISGRVDMDAYIIE